MKDILAWFILFIFIVIIAILCYFSQAIFFMIAFCAVVGFMGSVVWAFDRLFGDFS